MWERLLFLLLCAHLVQFNGSDSFKYDNKNELNKTSSYLIADQFIHGEESLNESYSKSGMGKIRRVRSIQDDLKILEDENEKLRNASEKAAKLVDEIRIEIVDKENEIIDTQKNLTAINGELDLATKTEERANRLLQNANTYIRIRQVLFEEAEEAEKAATAEMKKKTSISRIRLAIHEEKKSVYKAAEIVQDAARKIMRTASNAYDNAKNELKTLKTEVTTKEETLKDANTKKAKNDKTIEDDQNLTDIENSKTKEEEAVKVQEDKKAEAEKKKKPLDEMKQWMSGNDLFNKPEPWGEKTVVEAINECIDEISKAELKKNDNDPAKAKVATNTIREQNNLKKLLEELDPKLKYTGKLKDLVAESSDMIFVLKIQIANENSIIKDAKKEVTKLQVPLSLIETRLKNKKKEVNDDYGSVGELKDDAVIARNSAKDISKKFAKARVEVERQRELFEEKESLIGPLNDEYVVKKTVFAAKTIEADKADNEKTEDETPKNKALGAVTKSLNTLEGAKKATQTSSKQLKKSREDDLDYASRQLKNAKKTVKEKSDKKTKLTDLLRTEEEERNVLIGKEKDLTQTAFSSLTSKIYSDKRVKDKQEELKDYNTKEEERRGVVRMLKWGLGTTGGILVLLVIGGILAFVLIRRKKKAVKEKKPTRIEFKTEEGLTCIRREGEYDHYCIKGEDFKVMGPLFRGRVHNTIPTKHLLDDQVGGDKIDKITFPTELNEAYFIGEGVEHCEPDSVSISESKGDLFDGIDVSQSKKGKKDKDEKGNEKDAKMNVKDSKGSAPPSSEEKKSDEKKPDEKNKSKRASDANAKNGPSSAPDGGNKTEQQQKK